MKKLAITSASLLVLICMLFFSPDTVSAEEVTGTFGENIQWTYDDSTKTLTFTGTGAMVEDTYDNNWMPWESYIESAHYIVVEEGITHICENAFAGSGRLKEVTIPKSVTSLGKYAFYSSALTHIDLHDGITSIGASAFASTKLEEITIPAGVTELSDGLFCFSENLKKVELHDGITTIGSEAFRECKSLQSIIIPDSVTVLDSGAFDGCIALTEVTLSKKITTISSACFRETGLQEISIPDKVTTIRDNAFENCNSLKKVTLGSGLKEIDTSAFDRCNNLKEFSVNQKNRTFTTDNFGAIYSKDKKTLMFIPKGFAGEYTVSEGTLQIRDYAARNCVNLTGVVIPDSVKEISSYAFDGCASLKNVDLGNGVQTLGTNAFYDCDSLEALTLPASLTFLDTHALGNCDELHSIVFLGDRPDIEYNFSLSNGAICWYPLGNTTWKDNLPVTMYDDIDWRPRCTGEHDFVEEEGLPATCTQEGHEAYVWCQTCGFFPVYPKSIPVLDHAFDEWVYITPAGTPEAQHRVSHTCTLCGLTETPYASTVDPSELPDSPVLPPEDASESTEDATTDNTESDTPAKNPVKLDTPTILITAIVIIAVCLIGIVVYFTIKNKKTE